MIVKDYSKRVKSTIEEIKKEDVCRWLMKNHLDDVTDSDIEMYKEWLMLKKCYPVWLPLKDVTLLNQLQPFLLITIKNLIETFPEGDYQLLLFDADLDPEEFIATVIDLGYTIIEREGSNFLK